MKNLILLAFLGIIIIILYSCKNEPDFKFERGTKLIYQSDYRDSLNNLICSEELEFIGTGEKVHFSDRQDKIFYNFGISATDSAKFVDQPRLYPDFTYSLSWQKTFGQGIIQNENRIWLHPLRANQYRFTQDCPFPEVRFPIEVGNKWETGGRTGTDFKTPITSNYFVEKTDKYQGKIGTLRDCWYIKSSSTFNEKRNTLNMIFHKKKGFILFEYILHNQDRITIELVGTSEVKEENYKLYEERDEHNR